MLQLSLLYTSVSTKIAASHLAVWKIFDKIKVNEVRCKSSQLNVAQWDMQTSSQSNMQQVKTQMHKKEKRIKHQTFLH